MYFCVKCTSFLSLLELDTVSEGPRGAREGLRMELESLVDAFRKHNLCEGETSESRVKGSLDGNRPCDWRT